MNRTLASIAIMAVLAAMPAMAQTQDDFDDFGIVDDGATLDQVAPDDGGMAPVLPQVAETPDQPPAANVAPTEPMTPAISPAGTTADPNVVPRVEPPTGWQKIALAEVSAWLPPEFAAVQQEDDNVMYFNGDMEARRGYGFGIIIAPSDDEELPPEATVTVDRQVSLDGQTARWRELHASIGDGHSIDMIMVRLVRPSDPEQSIILVATAYGLPLEQQRAAFDKMLGALRIGEPPSTDKIGEALGGLVHYDVPKDWHVNASANDQRIGFSPLIYSGYIVFSRGPSVTGAGGADEDIPAGVTPVSSEIFGQPADLFRWTTDQAYFQVGATMNPGRMDYYRLKGCIGSDPLGVVIAGVPDFIDGAEFRSVLDNFALNLPAGLTPCQAASVTGTPPQTVPRTVPPTVVTGGANRERPKKGGASAAKHPSPTATTAPAPKPAMLGKPVDVQGVTFILPDGWTVQNDRADDKLFHSPDGRWTLLSFWWFPDEPLLGYDDITAVENMIIDHEPVTRIHSAINGRLSIQNVSERARGDGKRFIFTIEGEGVSTAEVQAMHDNLIANLHLQGGFDPSKRVDPLAVAVPVQMPRAVESSAPAPTSRTTGPGSIRIDFANGLQGWTGTYAVLAARPSGGPTGGGVLEAFCAGDGHNGYVIAPDAVLGNWSGATALRVSVKTGPAGDYFDALQEDDHRGDVYLESNGKTATINFPRRVGKDWTLEEVRFDSPDWRLGGGAQSVRDVLQDVTAFHLRIEFLNGDVTAWLSSIELVADAGVQSGKALTPSSATPENWTTYLNPRFGTRIDYPSGLFHALPQPENGDGQTFETADGSARLPVFGQSNFDGLNARAMMERDRDWGNYDSVTYKAAGKGWYVLSGYIGKSIFYRKAVLDTRKDVVHTFEINYPQSARTGFDHIVTRMAKSFGHQ